jgi:hypothetical protein
MRRNFTRIASRLAAHFSRFSVLTRRLYLRLPSFCGTTWKQTPRSPGGSVRLAQADAPAARTTTAQAVMILLGIPEP